MAVPQEFSDLFLKLQQEVETNIRRKTSLEQACKSLAGKERFLAHSLAELQQQVTDLKAKQAHYLEDKTAELVRLEAACTDAQKRLDNLTLLISGSENDLKVMKQATDDAIVDLNKQLETTRQEIIDAEAAKDQIIAETEQARAELTEVKARVTQVKQDLETAQTEYEQTQAELQKALQPAAAELQDIQDKTAKANQVYQELLEQTKQAKVKLAEIAQQHTEYLEYEERATKVLQAREAALLEREESLEREIALAKRRHGVLDKIE